MEVKTISDAQKQHIKHTLRIYFIGLLIGALLAAIFVFVVGREKSDQQGKELLEVTKIDTEPQKSVAQEVTVELVSKKLENISALSTAEMIYTGLYSVTEGKIPFITKKGFSMVYSATVRAGIDASQIEVEITDEAVTVLLPAAEIQMSKVDPDSIQFYDEKFALFNQDKKTDVTEAISIAEQDVQEKANTDGLLERATQQAEYIIKGILEGSVAGRKVVVKTK